MYVYNTDINKKNNNTPRNSLSRLDIYYAAILQIHKGCFIHNSDKADKILIDDGLYTIQSFPMFTH